MDTGRCVEAESWRVVVSSSDGSTDEEGDRRIRTKNKRRDKRKKLGAWWVVAGLYLEVEIKGGSKTMRTAFLYQEKVTFNGITLRRTKG